MATVMTLVVFCTLYMIAATMAFMLANLAAKILGADDTREFSDIGLLADIRLGLVRTVGRIFGRAG